MSRLKIFHDPFLGRDPSVEKRCSRLNLKGLVLGELAFKSTLGHNDKPGYEAIQSYLKARDL